MWMCPKESRAPGAEMGGGAGRSVRLESENPRALHSCYLGLSAWIPMMLFFPMSKQESNIKLSHQCVTDKGRKS